MGNKRRVNHEGRQVSHVELWDTSWSLLNQGQNREEGSFHQFAGSFFTAFSLEAYLNHIGPKVFRNWALSSGSDRRKSWISLPRKSV